MRIATLATLARVVSSSAMATTGPSSPQVPYARIESPTRGPMRPRSAMMGSSVPRAVVVRMMAMATPSMLLSLAIPVV